MTTADVPTSMGVESYMAERVEDQLRYYGQSATSAKRKYMVFQSSIIVLGLLVPVVVNVPGSWGQGADLTIPIKVTVTILSLSLAMLNGLLNFRKYGDLWLSFRMTEEMLKQEKFLFLARAGKYSNNSSAYRTLVETVESLVSAEHNKFRSLIEDARRPTVERRSNQETAAQ